MRLKIPKTAFGLLLGFLSVSSFGNTPKSLSLSISADIDQTQFRKFYSVEGERGGPLLEGQVSLDRDNKLYTDSPIRFTVLEHEPDGSSSTVLESFNIKVNSVSAKYIRSSTAEGLEPVSPSIPTPILPPSKTEQISNIEDSIESFVDSVQIHKADFTKIDKSGQSFNSFSVRSTKPIPKSSPKLGPDTIEVNVSVMVSPVII